MTPAADQIAAVRDAALDAHAMSGAPGWLQAFVRRAWPIVDPTPLVWPWHFSLICEELEKVASGETRELAISQPPGTGKSILSSALFPPGLALRDPSRQVLTISHVDKFVTRDAIRHRNVITSAWYRGLVAQLAEREGIGLVKRPDGTLAPWDLSRDQREKTNFVTTAMGGRQIGTVGGGITGARTGGLVVDDPFDAKKLERGSPAAIAEATRFVLGEWDSNWKNRVDPRRGFRMSVHQGLQDGDLNDELSRRGVRTLILPMEHEPDHPFRHPRDPRRTPGQLLFPGLYDQAWVDDFKSTPGGLRVWGPQYQQRRTRLGGALFSPRLFGTPPVVGYGAQRFRGDPMRFAASLDALGISLDCTFKDAAGSDRVCAQVWGWKPGVRALLDEVHERLDLTATCGMLASLAAKWRVPIGGRVRLRFVLIELKANGDGVRSLMAKRIPVPLLGYNPSASKWARAQISDDYYQTGTIWLPDASPEWAPWMHAFETNHRGFRGLDGDVDDEIDAESMMMIHLDDEDAKKPTDALKNARDMLAALRGQ